MTDDACRRFRLYACMTAAVIFLLSISAVAAGEELFTPDHVARLRAVTQAEISPDGSRVAYVLQVPRRPWKDEDGRAWSELHVTDPLGNSRPYVTGRGNVSRIAWTPDGRGITFLAKRGDDEANALYLIPLEGGEARRVAASSSEKDGIKSYSLSPDGRSVAFLAVEAVPEEIKKQREKGFDQVIYEEDVRPVRVWIVALEDEDAEPRMLDLTGSASELHWSPVGDRIVVALAPTPLVDESYTSRQFAVVDVGSGSVTGRVETGGKVGPIRWSPDGKNLALIAGIDKNDPSAGRLMVVPATGGKPRVLNADAESHAVAVGWRDPRTVIYLVHEGVWAKIAQIGADGSDGRVLAEAGRPVFTSLTVSRDGNAASLLASSPGHPPEAFIWKSTEPEPIRLTDSNPWMEEMALAQQEVVPYAARDGLEIQGLLIHPLKHAEGERVPLVLVVHGGPEAHFDNGWLTTYSRPGQVLAARGFAVFYPNYRGSTGRGLAFSKLSQGDAAGKEFDDYVDGVDALVERGLVDGDRVGITGSSYGGYASGWGATYYSERFAASVMFVGISNKISKVGETDIPNEQMNAHALDRVWDRWDFYLERSPIYHAGKSRTPTLILHGDSDPRVHPSQSMEMYRHLKLRSRAPVRLVFYMGEGHGNRRAASRYDYTVRMLRWMEHYLKGDGGDPPPYEIDYGFADDEEDGGEESD